MSKTLIIKNIRAEGPGTIEDFLKDNNIPYKIVEMSEGEAVPPVDAFTHVVVMGGPVAVYEMHRHAYLKAEAEYLKEASDKGKRILGVCLGAQLLAHVLGARVYAGGIKEIGWYKVDITPEGMKDPLVASLSLDGGPKAEIFHWHGDTFDLPQGAVRMASNETYPNQAFRYGSGIYALQFHIEITPEIIKGWFEGAPGVDVKGMVLYSEKIYPGYLKRAMGFYRGFWGQK